ncbi:MAG: polysaccharide pyruvyl transferase family protein [Gammaproteobacteria bacterium]
MSNNSYQCSPRSAPRTLPIRRHEDQKLKIGIITYHCIPNYGALLQAIALQRFLKESGFHAQVIDYEPLPVFKQYIVSFARSILQRNGGAIRRRLKHCYQFVREQQAASSGRYFRRSGLNEMAGSLDILICGADELWNFRNPFGFNPSYILDFGPKETLSRLSYAVSVGAFDPNHDESNWMKERLKYFTAALVRDSETVRVVKNTGAGCPVEEVVDPIFLHSFPELIGSTIKEPYMVLTGGLSQAELKLVLDLADKLNLRAVALGYTYSGFSTEWSGVSPYEWLYHLQRACLIVSSLFHATAFALKYEVPFYTFARPPKLRKLLGLLSPLGLESRLLCHDVDSDLLAADAFDIEFEGPSRLIHEMTERSKTKLIRLIRSHEENTHGDKAEDSERHAAGT